MENNVAVADNRGRQTTEVEDTWRTKPIGHYKKYKSTEEYKRVMLRQINACLILVLVTSISSCLCNLTEMGNFCE